VNADGPEVSVVVATYNRARLLQQTLGSLLQQEGIDRYEVVVIDDGSDDETWEQLQRTAASTDRIVPIRMPQNSGAATARNAGWRAARAPVIAFTDDDCTPDAGWLAALVRRMSEADIVQGRTVPRPDQLGSYGPFSRSIEVEREEGYYETCNVGYHRALLERLGGFDEDFRFPYGEDTDLAWRAKKSGASTLFADEVVVFHEVWPSRYIDHLRDIRRRSGMVQLFSKHPEIRRHLGTKLFFRPGHRESLMAAGGLALLAGRPTSRRRWMLAAALGARYAWVCRKCHRGPRPRILWAGVVPLAFIADLYDTAVMARASIKYRTLLL
jgi:glycosyltransferase involved in cell wall biosynthesis